MLDLSDKHLAPASTRAAPHPVPASGLEDAPLPDIGRTYRHYKGGLYRVENLCSIEASMKPGVLYRSLDPLQKHVLYMRPSAEFMGTVGTQGSQARFSALNRPERAALDALVPPDLASKALVDEVLQAYDVPSRFFHTRERVYSLFERAQKAQIGLVREQLVAMLFLDVICVPGVTEGSNERLSALVMQDMAQRMGEFDVEKAARIINDSATGRANSHESHDVLDLDIAGLADTPVQFCASEELIWLENRHLLDRANARKDFDTRRLKFLLARAEQGPLYNPQFAHLEEAARDNLEGLRQAWVRKYRDKKGG